VLNLSLEGSNYPVTITVIIKEQSDPRCITLAPYLYDISPVHI